MVAPKVNGIWPIYFYDLTSFHLCLPPALPTSSVSLLFLQQGSFIPTSGPLPCLDLCKAGSSGFRSLCSSVAFLEL